jgi:hypothetical protein
MKRKGLVECRIGVDKRTGDGDIVPAGESQCGPRESGGKAQQPERSVRVKSKGPIVFSVLVLVFFMVFVWEAREWRLQARLYPWAIGIPMIVLCVIHIFHGLKGEKKPAEGPSGNTPVDFQFTQEIDPELARRRALNAFFWIFGFFVGIYLFGFSIAIPAFVFLYLKVQSQEPWGISVALTAGAWVMFWGLFDWLLKLPFPEGLIFSFIGQG